jgi:hypothetical protein
MNRHLLITVLVAALMSGINSGAYAELFVSNSSGSILRYDETTGGFLSEFIPAGSGGLVDPTGLIFGPDGNLYVCSNGTNRILRYDGITGDPLPSPGNFGATFASPDSSGLMLASISWLIFGPDGNVYVKSWRCYTDTRNQPWRQRGRAGREKESGATFGDRLRVTDGSGAGVAPSFPHEHPCCIALAAASLDGTQRVLFPTHAVPEWNRVARHARLGRILRAAPQVVSLQQVHDSNSNDIVSH